MRQWVPTNTPECVKHQFPHVARIHVVLFFVVCLAVGILSWMNSSYGILYAFSAVSALVFASLYTLYVMGFVRSKRLVRHSLHKRFEMCCECGYPVPTGAVACPECGAAWDPDEAQKSWKSAEKWLRLREHTDKKRRGASS